MVESLTLKQLVSVMNLNLGKQEGKVNPLVPRGGCDGERAERLFGQEGGAVREKVL